MHLPSYDRVIGAWVPVEPEYVAPDGASYILHNESTLGNDKSDYFYLVDAKTGNRRLLLPKEGPMLGAYWTVVNYASEGIYPDSSCLRHDTTGPWAVVVGSKKRAVSASSMVITTG